MCIMKYKRNPEKMKKFRRKNRRPVVFKDNQLQPIVSVVTKKRSYLM